jgi:ABC-type nitrate/sulfonate/bicarbonate transport system substrate-binding protein
MVVRKEFLEQHPDAVARFTEAVFRANALFAADPEQALELAQGFYEETGVTQSEDDLKRTIELYEWVDLQGGADIFESGDAADSVNAYQEMLVRNGTATDVAKPTWLNESAIASALVFAGGR